MEALHVGKMLLCQPLTAENHLAGSDAGILGQGLQGQTLDTQLLHSLLLSLQSAHVQKKSEQS